MIKFYKSHFKKASGHFRPTAKQILLAALLGGLTQVLVTNLFANDSIYARVVIFVLALCLQLRLIRDYSRSTKK